MGSSLRDMVINKFDVVDAGDNPPAKIVLFKNKGGQDTKEGMTNKDLMKGVEYDMELKDILAKLEETDQNFVKTEFEARTNDIASLTKSVEDKDKEIEKQKTDIEQIKKDFDDLKKSVKKEADSGEEGENSEDVIKNADPKVKEQFEKMQKRLEDSESGAKIEKEKVAKLEKDVEMGKFTEVAKEMIAISKESDKLADLLYTIKKAVPEEKYNELKEILDSANGVIKESKLLTSVGSGESKDGKGAESTIKAKVEALRKTKPDLTPEQAEEQILIENPELYEDYNKEKKGV